jgi:hypothetical protein
MYGAPFWIESFNKNVAPCDNILSSCFQLPKYVKFVELTMVQIVNNKEDKRCFSILVFMKL